MDEMLPGIGCVRLTVIIFTLIVLSYFGNSAIFVQGRTFDPEECPKDCPECPPLVLCPPGISKVLDSCGCCYSCAKQLGENCDALWPCDVNLNCSNGICRANTPAYCKVGSKIYQDGETWKPDCQTECQCQDGVFGCADVCQPDKPESECPYGRTLLVESDCCSRWVCQDKPTAPCSNITTEWTDCSCDAKVSHQWSNHNPECRWVVRQKDCDSQICAKQPESEEPKLSVSSINKAQRFCETSLYHRLEFFEEDNCKSIKMVHQRSCLHQCHTSAGTTFCCSPNEYSSKTVRLICQNGVRVRRTIAMITGCACKPC